MEGAQTQYQFAASMLDHAFVITSPSIVTMAAKKLDTLPSLATAENPAAVIHAGLSAQRLNTGSSVFDLRYRGADPADCAAVLDALMETYGEFLGENQKSVGKEMADLIADAQETLRRDLAAKEQRYVEFKADTPLFWQDGEATNIHQERQSQIEESRAQAIIANGELESKIRAMQAAIERGASREVLLMMVGHADGNTMSSVLSSDDAEADIFPLLLQEEQLSQKLAEDHPKLKSVRRAIRFTRQFQEQARASLAEEDENGEQPRDVLSTYVESLREQLAAGEERVRQLDTMFQQEQEEAKKLAAYETKDAAYRSDIERTQSAVRRGRAAAPGNQPD